MTACLEREEAGEKKGSICSALLQLMKKEAKEARMSPGGGAAPLFQKELGKARL